MKIVKILIARPQFIKTSILSKLIKSQKGFKETIVCIGQHYDFTMSDIFIDELKVTKSYQNPGIKGLNKQSPEEISRISSKYKIKKLKNNFL